MGAGNPTISWETETQVRAACQPGIISTSFLHLLKLVLILLIITNVWRVTAIPDGSVVISLPSRRRGFDQGEDPLEKDMATHSSTLAWEIPWTEEPGRL